MSHRPMIATQTLLRHGIGAALRGSAIAYRRSVVPISRTSKTTRVLMSPSKATASAHDSAQQQQQQRQEKSISGRGIHSSAPLEMAQPMNPDPRGNPNMNMPPRDANVGRFADFDLKGRVIIVTGGARGLGLALAEAACEAGAKVYCLDIFPEPGEGWNEAQRRVNPEWRGFLRYREQNVTDTDGLDAQIASIAAAHGRLDGVVAAAGIQQITPAAEYNITDLNKMMAVNYSGVFMTATAAARQMFKYRCPGSIVLIASISGSIANRGLISPVYNSSKAAVVQLARNLAMEWSPVRPDGTGGVRVNCLSPGNILTPMVRKNFEEVPGLRKQWEAANMMGRLAETHEFKGGTLFLLGRASSFMTGSNLIIDGGLSAW